MRKKYLYWAPRILSIIFILFLSLFSLDVFEMDLGFFGTIAALFIHLIPSFILTILLIISWKREIVGGVTFILAGIVYFAFILRNIIKTGFEWYYLAWFIQISGATFIIGILWILNWKKRKKLRGNENRFF